MTHRLSYRLAEEQEHLKLTIWVNGAYAGTLPVRKDALKDIYPIIESLDKELRPVDGEKPSHNVGPIQRYSWSKEGIWDSVRGCWVTIRLVITLPTNSKPSSLGHSASVPRRTLGNGSWSRAGEAMKSLSPSDSQEK